MRILFYVHGYKPAYRLGGPIHSVSSLAENLVELGHEVCVLTTNSNLHEPLNVPLNVQTNVNGVSVIYFNAYSKSYFFSKLSNNYLYCENMFEFSENICAKFDIIHTHLPFIYPTLVGYKMSVRHKIPLVYSQRGVLDSNRLRFRAIKKFLYLNIVEKKIIRSAARLIALTNHEVVSYKKIFSEAPCCVVPNGITLTTTPTEYAFRNFSIPELEIRSDDVVILFLSRLHKLKNPKLLAQAAKRFVGLRNHLKFIIAGADDDGSFNELERVIGLDSDFIKLIGHVEGQMKLTLLNRAQIYILPSESEGFSISLLEALAFGVPSLISSGCYFPEAIEAGGARLINLSINSIANEIHVLLSDRNHLLRMSDCAKSVAARFSWKNIAKKIEAEYTAVIRK